MSDHAACSCHQPVEEGSTLDRHFARPLSRALGGVRVNKGAAMALAKYCQGNACSQSSGIRVALAKLAKETDPAAQLTVIIEALGLEDDASAGDILAAVQALLGSDDDAPADGSALDDVGAPAPPTALSKAQIGALSARGLPATQQAWATLCKSMIRSTGDRPRVRSGAEAVQLSKAEIARQVSTLDRSLLAQIKSRGMTPEEFIEKRSAATRRA